MKKFKKPICLILSILLLMSPLFSLSSFADEEEDNKAELEQQLNKELNENEGYKDTLTTLDTVYKDKEGANYTIPADRMSATKNLSYIMWRVFRSDYMYDVSTFSPPKLDEDEMNLFDFREISKTADGGATLCNKKRDGKFLYHNCDIPTVIRSAFQNLQTLTNDKPLEGAEKTTAYEESLGIPAKIPGNEVPLNLANSSNKYTGLELFGYDLKHTSYNGEWDNIQVNTSARLLSNYGILDKIKLGGKSLVEGTKSVFADFLNVRSLDDLKKTVFSIPSRFVGGTITTLLDTSDANVAATRAWGRPDFAQTVYNGVHYLPNKLVATRAMSAYADFLVANFEKEAKKNKELKPWLDYMVDKLPEYNAEDYPIYKNQEEYDKYQKDLKKYKKYKKCKDEGGKICGFKRSKPKKVKLKKYTKEERFDLYKNNEDVQKFMAEAEALGIENVLNKKGVKDFSSLRKEYGKAFTTGIKKKFSEGSKAVRDIGESLARKFYNQYPQYDVKKEISHWVCTGNDNPSLKTLVDAPYLFTSEYYSKINPECGNVKLRKTIKGGNNGSGDTAKDKITDTRWKQFMATKEEGVIRKAINSGGFIDGLNKFFVKLTNTLLSFSFDSVITQSGLDKIVVPFVKELRDGMYYPLISIALATTGLWMFYTFAIKNFAPGNFLKYTLSLLLVFLFILFFLDKPEKTINVVEKVPSMMDNLILDAVYGKDDNVDNQLCTVEGNKIRSIQCEVWQIGIFNPWLMGQFGTTKLSDLNEKNMKNTNKDLIGSPKVDFGAGKTMNNWALYQLKLTKSGTITTKDTKENSKEKTYTENSIDNNMFKLVDLQFGPNNAKGRDTRFASQWASRSGKNGAGLLGLVVSFVMLLILGKFLIYKIQLSLSMFLQIMLLPFFALVGMLPNGVNRMKDFGMNFVGLFLKRITVTLFTAILLKMLLAGANSGIVGIPYYIYVISILLSFNILWKDYAALIASGIESPFKGNSAGSNLLSGDYVDMKSAKTALAQANLAPRSVDQYLETKKEKLEARTSGAIAGGLIAMKTYNSRKNQMITVEKKSIEKDKDGNYYIATRTEQKKESAFDVIKEISREGAKKTDNWMYKKHRREGFGLLTQVINSQEKLDRELVTSITSGGRTANDASANLAYTRLRTLGKQRGFDLTPDDVANSVDLQRHIRQYAREMDKREIALRYKPETEDDLNSNMQALIESDERMKGLLNNIEKDVANAKKLTPENINAKKLAQLNAIQTKNIEYKESFQYKEEAKENYREIFYNIQLLKEKEKLQNDYLNKKVGLTDEEAEKLLTNSLTQNDLEANDNLRKKHEKLVKQGIADPVKNTEEVDKDKIVNIEFKEVKKRDLRPGEIKKAFEDYQKENNLTRDLSQEEMTKIIEELKKKTIGKKAIKPNEKEKLDIKITTYGDLLNKKTTNNSEGYDAILDFYKKELTELGLSEEISKIEKEVKNDIKDNYRRKLEVPNEK